MSSIKYPADQRKRKDLILADPETIDIICSHVANGGTLITLCETWNLPFGWIANWIHADPDRDKRYRMALNDRAEWGKERVLLELRRMGLSDIRQVFNEDGSLKPVAEWSEDISKAIQSVKIEELFEGTGAGRTQIGHTKKVKLWDKLASIKLIGQAQSLFIEQHVVRHTLEDLVSGANDVPKEPKEEE